MEVVKFPRAFNVFGLPSWLEPTASDPYMFTKPTFDLGEHIWLCYANGERKRELTL